MRLRAINDDMTIIHRHKKISIAFTFPLSSIHYKRQTKPRNDTKEKESFGAQKTSLRRSKDAHQFPWACIRKENGRSAPKDKAGVNGHALMKVKMMDLKEVHVFDFKRGKYTHVQRKFMLCS